MRVNMNQNLLSLKSSLEYRNISQLIELGNDREGTTEPNEEGERGKTTRKRNLESKMLLTEQWKLKRDREQIVKEMMYGHFSDYAQEVLSDEE